MDANRPIAEAIDSGQKYAEHAWKEYHTFIEIAKRRAAIQYNKAHYFDIHGNTMSTKTMLGYLIRKVVFDGDDAGLYVKLVDSSMRTLVEEKENEEEIVNLFL